MIIHCGHCAKLFYFDNATTTEDCPICELSAEKLASTIVFGAAANESSVTQGATSLIQKA
jgi:uncharacterized CHY-type Zn-finger protein